MQKVVIYPGRFQPMLAHHAEVYKRLQAQFPDADVYIGTSNKVDGEKSPFNFEEKQLIATAHGIPADRVLPGNLPYHKDSYPQFDQTNSMIIFAIGEKDLGRFPFDNVDADSGLQMTKRGEPRPAYYQQIDTMATDPVPMEYRGYITVAPTIQIGDEVASASAFRERIKNAPDEEEAKQYFVTQFGEYNEKVFNLIYNKIVRNKMSEELNILRQLAGLSEAPVNFDDYQTISPKDAKAAAERPTLRANADPEAAKFLPPDPKMFHSTIAKSVANRMGNVDVNDPSEKKEHFMQELLRSPAGLLGEINARLANDENGLAVSDRLSEIIENLEGGIKGLSDEDRQFVIKITANALKNMEIVKDPKSDKERDEYEAESLDLSDIRNDYGIEEASVCKQCGSSECDCPEGECTCEPVEEGKLPAGLQAYQDKKNGKKDDDADKDEDKEVDEDKDEDKDEVDEALNDLRRRSGIEVNEGKMKDVIQDAHDMSKEEFQKARPGFDYDEIHADYPMEESTPEESFDPMNEPTKYDSAMEVYDDHGEDALAEYLGMSSQEFDQELNEYCVQHGLHADDDRDTAIHGMVEQMIDDEHQMSDMAEPQVEDTANKAIDAAMLELRQLAGI
tara:strand:+ start:2273 stop:4129 length:1857 start_codon:yes stop_codon:yes gene_type:complete